VKRTAALVASTLILALLVPRPASAQEIVHFTTPSRNIDCMLFAFDSSTVADCLVKSATWKKLPKRPADCDLDWSDTEISLESTVTASSRRNSVTAGSCRGDIGPLCGPEECTVLAYGKTARLGPITCTSKATGVTCVTTAGPRRGFNVNRAGYTVLR
jgi:eukaryotic-like serine/threonine-protein kinase